MSNFPKIVAFPNDKKTRVIWWYGPIFKNTSNSDTPQVLVLTRLLNENNVLTNSLMFFRIHVTELELVRIGSIWNGRERQDSLYTALDNYRNNLEFTFDFTASEPKSVPFNSKVEEEKWLIPPYRYNLGDFKDQYVTKQQFYNSTLTTLESTNGITVLIPSLELLTSAISPEHKLLRTHLLQHPIDQICADYMNSGYEKDGAYVVESKNGYFRSNLTLLAYLKNDPASRARLSRIWTSMQAGSTKYSDRYPIILPYHPTELTLKGDGIKIDDNTFLMLRINGFSLPTDFPVHNIIIEPVQVSEQYMSYESQRNAPKPQNPRQKDDLPITGDNDPHYEAGEIYIRTEVRIIGPEPKIELFKKQKTNNAPPNPLLLDRQEIVALSSGEQNSRKDSKGIASAKQAPIKQGEDLTNIEWAVKELNNLTSDLKSDIKSFTHIGNDGIEYASPAFCYITESEMPQGHKRKWYLYDKSKKKDNEEESTKTHLRYRKFLIAKIVLKDTQAIYLLEIEQKGSEAFSGLLFKVNGDLSRQNIKALLLTITNNEGRFKKREKGRLVPIVLPIGENFVFEHRASTKLTQYLSPLRAKS